MSWYKVTLITQNLFEGVTHYTSCYTAEIAQITQKKHTFYGLFKAFYGQFVLFFDPFYKEKFFLGLFNLFKAFAKLKNQS